MRTYLRRAGVAVLAAALLGTGACAEDDRAGAPDVAASDSPAPSADAADDDDREDGDEPGAFPVTIEHKYGSTTVEEEPERVVAVGLTDIDPLLALDVLPVGYIDWYGDPAYPDGIWPWAEEARENAGDAEVEVMPRNNDEFLFERIAALEPDLIIGQYTGMTEEDYGLLTRIAPTVAQSGEHDDFTMPWQDMTRVIGQAVGRPARADELIAEVEEAFERAREEHPQFDGAQAIFAERFEAGRSYPRGSAEPRVRFLTDLGFEIPPEIAELAGDYGADLSDERMDLLDTADVLVWNLYEDTWREDLATNTVYQGLDVVAEGRDVFLGDVVGGALTWSSVLSLPYAVQNVAPQLAAAVAGEGAASPTPNATSATPD